MVKYFASATHQEIILGALEANEADTHVHCFFRKLNGLAKHTESSVFIELEKKNRIFFSGLKEELEHRLPSNIHKYKVDLGDKNDKEKYLKKFCKEVYASLSQTIKQELEAIEDTPPLYQEINSHIEFGKDRTKIFVGRKDIQDMMN